MFSRFGDRALSGIFFLAAGNDFRLVLDLIYGLGCTTIEGQARVSEPLKKFQTADDAFAFLNMAPTKSHFLRAWHPDMRGDILYKRRDFVQDGQPKYVELVDGWGLLNLHLEAIVPDGKVILASDMIHNSEKRALSWEAFSEDQGAVSSWDWAAVEKISRSICNQIRRKSSHIGAETRALPQAADLWRLWNDTSQGLVADEP